VLPAQCTPTLCAGDLRPSRCPPAAPGPPRCTCASMSASRWYLLLGAGEVGEERGAAGSDCAPADHSIVPRGQNKQVRELPSPLPRCMPGRRGGDSQLRHYFKEEQSQRMKGVRRRHGPEGPEGTGSPGLRQESRLTTSHKTSKDTMQAPHPAVLGLLSHSVPRGTVALPRAAPREPMHRCDSLALTQGVHACTGCPSHWPRWKRRRGLAPLQKGKPRKTQRRVPSTCSLLKRCVTDVLLCRTA
jgi:hypothetical protein